MSFNNMEKNVNFEKLNPEDQLKYCRKFVQESKYENERNQYSNVGLIFAKNKNL